MRENHAISVSSLTEVIYRHGLRPSAQRIAVLSCVANGRRHPSADEIFKALSPSFPSLSRTTVYNSLHALVDAGLIRELEIESGCSRYDFLPQPPHGHFVCRRCGRIFDMPMPVDIGAAAPCGCLVEDIDLFVKGLCPECSGADA